MNRQGRCVSVEQKKPGQGAETEKCSCLRAQSGESKGSHAVLGGRWKSNSPRVGESRTHLRNSQEVKARLR